MGFNGQCVWKFSQFQDPVRSLIARHERTAKGICEILSAKWVCMKYHNQSMMNWLAGPNGHRSNIDLGKLALLAQLHLEGLLEGDGNQQENKTRRLMDDDGVPLRSTEVGGAPDPGTVFDPENDLLDDFRRKVQNINRTLFALISITGVNGWPVGELAHTMAVKAEPINGAVFRYFDPNYGEFMFNTWNGFRNWFLYLFRRSGYRTWMGNYYTLRYFYP